VHYLAVVRFPIDHPNCHFHRFPWPESKTEGYIFWAFFHVTAPIQLLYISFRYRINRLFAFEHNYSVLLQPARLIKRISLTLFLRADTIRNHKIKGRSKCLLFFEHLLEGLGIAGVKMYGVSWALTNDVNKRHKLLRPVASGVLRNDIKSINTVKKKDLSLPIHLASVGILEKRKNQRLLLEIMKSLQPEQARLYLYGVGPAEQLLRKIVDDEKLSGRVQFMGWVESDDIWPDIDLLLMPSLHEGAPNAVLEALSHGVPVLASDIPEHVEILPQEDLLSTDQPEKWVEILSQNESILIKEIAKIASRQTVSCEKLNFNWENDFVELVSKI
jgi:glycosyltransferase involved in cell wall biosynthesis